MNEIVFKWSTLIWYRVKHRFETQRPDHRVTAWSVVDWRCFWRKQQGVSFGQEVKTTFSQIFRPFALLSSRFPDQFTIKAIVHACQSFLSEITWSLQSACASNPFMVIPVFMFHVNHLGPLCACHDGLYRLSNAFLSDVSQGGKHRHLAELELSSLWLLIVTRTFRSPRKWAPDVSKWESVWTWAAPVERKERLMSFFFFSKGWPWKEVGLECM